MRHHLPDFFILATKAPSHKVLPERQSKFTKVSFCILVAIYFLHCTYILFNNHFVSFNHKVNTIYRFQII